MMKKVDLASQSDEVLTVEKFFMMVLCIDKQAKKDQKPGKTESKEI